jgi:hypothetical protein
MLTIHKIRIRLLTFTLALDLGKAQAQTPIPSLIEKNGRHTLLVDGKPFLILGGQAHNSSA